MPSGTTTVQNDLLHVGTIPSTSLIPIARFLKTADKNDCSGQKTAPPGGGEKLDHSASLEIQRLCNTRHKQSMAAAGRPAPPTVAEGMILKKRPKNQEELAAMSAEVAASVEVVVLAQAECRRAFQQRVGR